MSEWLGKIGDRVELDVVIKSCIYRNAWGTNMRLYLVEDKHNNILTFRSTGKFGLGKKWRLDGVVKNHGEFHGQRQTHIADWGLMFPATGVKT